MIQAYFQELLALISENPFVTTHEVNLTRLSPNTGYVEGEISLIDGSRFFLFEFLRVGEEGVKRERYRYQYISPYEQTIFRYDNAPHHPSISTFPDHKHVGEDRIESSDAPLLKAVLEEIENIIIESIMKK